MTAAPAPHCQMFLQLKTIHKKESQLTRGRGTTKHSPLRTNTDHRRRNHPKHVLRPVQELTCRSLPRRRRQQQPLPGHRSTVPRACRRSSRVCSRRDRGRGPLRCRHRRSRRRRRRGRGQRYGRNRNSPHRRRSWRGRNHVGSGRRPRLSRQPSSPGGGRGGGGGGRGGRRG